MAFYNVSCVYHIPDWRHTLNYNTNIISSFRYIITSLAKQMQFSVDRFQGIPLMKADNNNTYFLTADSKRVVS